MQSVKFGLFSDLHLDIMHDGEKRIRTFLNDCLREQVDFVISVGDFTYPEDTGPNRCLCSEESLPVNLKNAMEAGTPAPKMEILKEYNTFTLPHYHTLGNHEMDFSSKDESAALLGMPSRYYDFVRDGWHFIILDTNHYRDEQGKIRSYCKGDYFGHRDLPYLDEEQLVWLKERLWACPFPAVLFSHQPLYPRRPGGGIKNYEAFRQLLCSVDGAADRVKMCVYGHFHADEYQVHDHILHYGINSISNHWVGTGYACRRFDPETERAFPNLCYTFPYKEPVYAMVTLDEKGVVIRGRKGAFVPPLPEELNYRVHPVSPSVEDREFFWDRLDSHTSIC